MKSMKSMIDSNKIDIIELKKNEVKSILDDMFDIIYSNMNEIAPTGNKKEEDYIIWKQSMLEELENKDKKWIFAFLDNELIGYLLYKENKDYINIDELQIRKDHQGDKVTYIKLLKHLLILSDDKDVKTYVNKSNMKSQALVNKLGFKIIEEKEKGFKYKISLHDLQKLLMEHQV